ncbi:MAG: Spy/CpxP family protein refolding chaperone [Saprospiraceae bacterium]|nr:Spy/CpxP family protein refolding chaperone [Saprospiraceae bacterium]
MKTKNAKSTFIAITLAIMLTLGLSNLTFAQQGKGKCDGNGPKFNTAQKGNGQHCMNLPDLTEEQQKKIKELRLKQMKAILPLKNEITEKQAHLKTLTTKEKVDMNAVNTTIDEITVVKAKMMKLKAAHQQEIRNLLTEEQRLIFDTRPARFGKGQGFGHGQGRGHGFGCGEGNFQGKGYGRFHGDCPYNDKK